MINDAKRWNLMMDDTTTFSLFHLICLSGLKLKLPTSADRRPCHFAVKRTVLLNVTAVVPRDASFILFALITKRRPVPVFTSIIYCESNNLRF